MGTIRRMLMELNPARKCKCKVHVGNESWHQSVSGWTYHACRCNQCKSVYRRPPTPKKRRVYNKDYPSVPWAEIPGGLVERRKKLWVAQGGLCALCHKPLDWEKAQLDHDHKCCPMRSVRSCGNCDRGVLHNACNAILGFCDDDPALLLKAIDYIGHGRDAEAIQQSIWRRIPETTYGGKGGFC